MTSPPAKPPANIVKTESWSDYLAAMSAAFDGLVVTAAGGAALSTADGFRQWVELTRQTHERDRNLYLIGNGGSAMMASHMATDATKNGHLRALALNDPSFLTAAGNDVAFDEVFALPLSRLCRAGDLLITISSSGNSPNVVRALETARQMGVTTVTLSAMSADNRSRTLGDLNFYVPARRYGWAESAHQVILHYWFDQYLDRHGQGAL